MTISEILLRTMFIIPCLIFILFLYDPKTRNSAAEFTKYYKEEYETYRIPRGLMDAAPLLPHRRYLSS